MKKSLLFIPLLSSLATLPLLIASKCDQKETQEQKDKKLTKKYEKEYIDKQRYVFDDFEQFKFNKEKHFRKNILKKRKIHIQITLEVTMPIEV